MKYDQTHTNLNSTRVSAVFLLVVVVVVVVVVVAGDGGGPSFFGGRLSLCAYSGSQ